MTLADGFGNYLYIIFAVVYVIYSIIKAGKKVTQNRPTVNKGPQPSPTVQPPTARPEPSDTGGDEIKKMLEELLGGGEEETVPEKQVLIPKPQPVQQKPKTVRPVSHAQQKPVQPAYQTRQKEPIAPAAFRAHPEIVQKVFNEPVQEEEVAIDFDIRQAVIYSEILKRPQY